MPIRPTRRNFLKRTAVGAAAVTFLPGVTRNVLGANDKLHIACIGVGGQGGSDMNQMTHERIVALCDVDERNLGKAKQQHAAAKTFHDFRVMLDEMHDEIDAVTVGTPDHTHAPATIRAIREHKHVFCEKPLTHTVIEARMVAREAEANKVVTQMGTQIHAGDNYRRVVELIRAGAIGKVHHVHTWVGTSYHGGDRPGDTPPVPKWLHWDQWIGAAPFRPYHHAYHPFNWRGWWDFGGGALADMACHHMDLPFWALGIRHPRTIEAKGPDVHAESSGQWNIVDYTFAKADMETGSNTGGGKLSPDAVADEVQLTWYHGGKQPPQVERGEVPKYGGGNLFVGSEGMLIADYGRHELLPAEKFKDYQRPEPSIAGSIGHYREWTEACKAHDPSATLCNFSYAGALTEAVLLGNVAFRSGKKIEWDGPAGRVTNAPEAIAYLHKAYREGWEL